MIIGGNTPFLQGFPCPPALAPSAPLVHPLQKFYPGRKRSQRCSNSPSRWPKLTRNQMENEGKIVSIPSMPSPCPCPNYPLWVQIDIAYFRSPFSHQSRGSLGSTINIYLKKQPQPMSSEYSSAFDAFLQSSWQEVVAENSQVLPPKKKNYRGLQEDSRRKSKKRHWKPHENRKYVCFLRENMELFEKNREDKRLMKINILMSSHVRSKNSTQCRSHHQKMLAHYKTIQNIIDSLCADCELEERKVVVGKEEEVVPVSAEEDIVEEMVEEGDEEREEKDIFEVLNNNCWGYDESCLF